MANILVHLSVSLLYFIFPGQFSFWPLLISAYFADFEYFVNATFGFIFGKRKKVKDFFNLKIGILHTLLGVFLISFPILLFVFKFPLFSIFVGLISHIILDLPAHKKFTLFWPITFKNPFFFELKFLKKIYNHTIYKKVELFPYEHLPGFSWLVVSNVIMLMMILLFIII